MGRSGDESVTSGPERSKPIASFIVRIWQEPAAPQGPELVRGSIEHVQSRKKQYFQGIEALLAIIQAETRSPGKAKRAIQKRSHKG